MPDTCKGQASAKAGNGLLSVCHGCPSLRVLSLPSYKGPKDALFALGMARQLRVLRLKGAQHLDDDVVIRIASNCRGIEDLDLSFNCITGTHPV